MHRIIPLYIQPNKNQLLKNEYDFNMYNLLLSLVTNLNYSRPTQLIKNYYQDLVDWIIQMTPKLIDNEQFQYDLSTRCRWILSGRNDFPICIFCHKPFGINRNLPIRYDYSKWCSNTCRQSDPIIIAKTKTTKFKNHGNENYCNVEKITQTFITNYGVTNPNKCREVRKKLEDTNLKRYGVKCVFQSKDIQQQIQQTNIKRYGVKSPLANPNIRAKGIITLIKKYGVDCSTKSQIIQDKRKQTFINNYGVDNNMKSKNGLEYWQMRFKAKYGVDNPMKYPEFQQKARNKYCYENIMFDSAPELALFIILKDNTIQFEYQPQTPFTYEFDKKQHLYYPDFKIGDIFFEIKGDQFFDKNGIMFCPYRKKSWSDEQYAKINDQYAAKQKCMVDNNVVILKSKDYIVFLKYVEQKYGKNYLKQFRVNKSTTKSK